MIRRQNWNRLRTNGKNNDLTFRFGTLNTGAYNNKEDEISSMMKQRRLDLLGMAETRFRGKSSGRYLRDGYVLIYNGVEEGNRNHGVAIIVGPRLAPFT